MLKRFFQGLRRERAVVSHGVQQPSQPTEPHHLASPDISPDLLPPVPHGGLKPTITYGKMTCEDGVERTTVNVNCPYRCGFSVTHADRMQDIAFVGAELLVMSHVKYHCVRAPQDIKDGITAARR